MSTLTARDLARRVLNRVDEGSYATLALAGELSRSRLGDADRGLATELVYGTLKWRIRLDRALSACASRGLDGLDRPVLDALRMAAYQLLFLRVPDHAAVDDAVESVKRLRGPKLAGFTNALLRRLGREREPRLPSTADAEGLSIVESAPRWLVDRALAVLGGDGARAFLAGINAPAPTWLRTNTLRATRDQLAASLLGERPGARLVASTLLPEALAVRHGGDLASTEAFGKGWCTPQDLGAQLVARLAEPRAGERILDACAGVGGKSAHLAALCGDGADIDAADLSPRKLELAADLFHRLGVTRARTLTADLTDERAPLRDHYDRVILDAPCSGLGVLRRHPEAKWRGPPSELGELASLQGRLLEALSGRVRPGGLLVYSVCTFTLEEGPERIAAFLARHPDFTVEPPGAAYAALATTDGALRTWPHRDDADAFFAVRLRRAP